MNKRNKFSGIGPIIVLFILSPVIAELLFGSTPASRAVQLIFESLFYGSGALLIREVARRNQLGWTSIILLGIAFGTLEECILLQSAFNPTFLGNDLSFGRAWGVNWVWTEYIIGYHAIWSITIPVLLTELIFPDRKAEPWLSRWGIWLTSIIFALSCAAFYSTFYKMSGFSSTLVHYLIAGSLVLCFIGISFYLPEQPLLKHKLKTPAPVFVGIIAFAGSILWLYLFSLIFKHDSGLPSWIVQLSGIFILFPLVYLISGWSRQNWKDIHRFSLASGALMASMLFGLFVLMQMNNQLDQICQVIFILITIALLIALKKRRLNSYTP